MKSIIEWFVKEKKRDDNDDDGIEETDFPQESESEFKSFSETYKIITFALSLGLLYPNPATRWFRFIGTSLTLTSVTPLAAFMLIDIYYCWLRMDIIEIIRHSTIVGPFLGCFLKMYFMVWFQEPAYEIISEINRDYDLYNRASEEYKKIARVSIKDALNTSEKWWPVTVITCVMSFPVMAATFTLYSYLFKEEPQRYMIHELNKPWSRDPLSRLETPYYEIMNAYMMYCASFYVMNFMGYDGFYGVAINHAVLKIQMYCKALEDAMNQDTDQVLQRVVTVIHEQNRTFRFVGHIQYCFNLWLGVIFLATMIQLCNLLYHISEGNGLDVRYFIFISGGVIHIYLPCHFSAKLKAASAEVATHFYCCGWEHVPRERVRSMLAFMIARAQRPLQIVALGMITFDMELFVQILQTSYSMYTLLSS